MAPSETALQTDEFPFTTTEHGLRLYEIEGEPYVKDVELGAWLGMTQPSNIRQTVASNIKELQSEQPIHVVREMVALGSGAKREIDVNYLTEDQVLLLTIYSRTPKGREFRRLLIDVFIAWRDGKIVAKAGPAARLPSPKPAPKPVIPLTERIDPASTIEATTAFETTEAVEAIHRGFLDDKAAKKIGDRISDPYSFQVANDEDGRLVAAVSYDDRQHLLTIRSDRDGKNAAIDIADLRTYFRLSDSAIVERLRTAYRETGTWLSPRIHHHASADGDRKDASPGNGGSVHDGLTLSVSYEAVQLMFIGDPTLDPVRRAKLIEAHTLLQSEINALRRVDDVLATKIRDAEQTLAKIKSLAWQAQARLDFDTESVFEALFRKLRKNEAEIAAAAARIDAVLAWAARAAMTKEYGAILTGPVEDLPRNALVPMARPEGEAVPASFMVMPNGQPWSGDLCILSSHLAGITGKSHVGIRHTIGTQTHAILDEAHAFIFPCRPCTAEDIYTGCRHAFYLTERQASIVFRSIEGWDLKKGEPALDGMTIIRGAFATERERRGMPPVQQIPTDPDAGKNTATTGKITDDPRTYVIGEILRGDRWRHANSKNSSAHHPGWQRNPWGPDREENETMRQRIRREVDRYAIEPSPESNIFMDVLLRRLNMTAPVKTGRASKRRRTKAGASDPLDRTEIEDPSSGPAYDVGRQSDQPDGTATVKLRTKTRRRRAEPGKRSHAHASNATMIPASASSVTGKLENRKRGFWSRLFPTLPG